MSDGPDASAVPASLALRAPRASRLGRLSVYLAEQFPPAVMLPAGVASFLALHWTLQALAGLSPLTVTWRMGLGALTVVGFMLLLRVYDELKDVEADLRLGKAGDPRYKDRAIVTGQVRVEDVAALRWWVTGGLVLANLPLGLAPLGAFAVVFLLAWLSFRWFFCGAIQRNLLLAFVTHNPLSLAVEGYVLVLFAHELGWARLGPEAIPVLIGLWFPVAAWETSRKVRLPADETEYQTYSLLLGWRVAACLPLGFVSVSAGCLAWAALRAELSWIYVGLLLAAAAAVVGAVLLLVVAPSARRANLRPLVEAYTVVAQVGLVIALAASRGVALS